MCIIASNAHPLSVGHCSLFLLSLLFRRRSITQVTIEQLRWQQALQWRLWAMQWTVAHSHGCRLPHLLHLWPQQPRLQHPILCFADADSVLHSGALGVLDEMDKADSQLLSEILGATEDTLTEDTFAYEWQRRCQYDAKVAQVLVVEFCNCEDDTPRAAAGSARLTESMPNTAWPA